ncbi:SulP family inorganic anion transporter [Clostridium tertium]|jgi:sulfate permease, SulP family|uniref:SulP family inorganic anion transporter n=3 Tax=Clostridiaceae TaxID=31979 RepID=UPI00019B0373|nr:MULTISPECIES: SulP family inorganic anion transporter [Clostridium]MBP1867191.1 SulP family sulfate permease [Clostridium tertium]MDB1923431.1 SulP family inorganic anion transporter [Clostridium tertium]MDB1927863.1 SulP family inorganic anion transporter [Clostridium tertium]MDB1931487.1 SulP family inorganic anion transporter [Clostridium tertium]MDB1934663.1 SulP family inorganic anion transporter [Clostridium tertium]
MKKGMNIMLKSYIKDIKNEFKGYDLLNFKQDLMAGITVTAVALPLALAFGVSSGATAAAGLITAILAGVVIGALSGGSFQISGPTGAMSAILVALFQKYGLEGVWIAGALAGLILILAGILKLGKVVSYIPTPVVTGFTSGIALIIAIGQLDNFFGVSTKSSESAAIKVLNFFSTPLNPNWYALSIGILVVVIMLIWPKKLNNIIPSSLIGLIIALSINMIFKLPVDIIGDIPQKLILDDRLSISSFNLDILKSVLVPAISIAALAMIESLLCGEVGKKMKGDTFDANRELIAQGIGNFIIPFFGGVPATAAIARTSVAIKSGARTRLVSMFHAVFLMLSMFLLAPIMSNIPLAALAGVLMVTAWRMNEWENIKYIFSKRFKGAILKFLITMFATVALDLTQAILIGVIFSSLLFIVKISNMDISISEVDEKRLDRAVLKGNNLNNIKVVYFTGPLFFATAEKFKNEVLSIKDAKVIILSMRGVPLIDTSALQALSEMIEEVENRNCKIMLCGLQQPVKELIDKSGFAEKLGSNMIFWSADQAIKTAETLIA